MYVGFITYGNKKYGNNSRKSGREGNISGVLNTHSVLSGAVSLGGRLLSYRKATNEINTGVLANEPKKE